MDCFNHNCPFRVNDTSNANRCECVACPNVVKNDVVLVSNHTMTEKELKYEIDSDYGIGRWA